MMQGRIRRHHHGNEGHDSGEKDDTPENVKVRYSLGGVYVLFETGPVSVRHPRIPEGGLCRYLSS